MTELNPLTHWTTERNEDTITWRSSCFCLSLVLPVIGHDNGVK